MSSFYNDVPDGPETQAAQISPEGETEETEDTEEGATALLPKSIVGDLQPGATVTLTVVKVYGDEVEVRPQEME